ncbi:MAG: TolC family protein [Proteobacteria bacterium]|nr:TolC family protein [Pseudomonadota bacterium]
MPASRRPALSLKLVPPLAAILLASGCASLAPQPLTSTEIAATTQADGARLQEGVEPLAGPLTLEEAIARALKYNLDRRTRLMEEAIASGQLEVGQYDLLPKVIAGAGYRSRDNELISRSRDSVTGQPSLAHPFISSDRNATTTELTFTWSLLDFGQSYYASKQNADRVLIAGEHRRKALHLLVQDVRTAFWRAASAQKLKDEVLATLRAGEEALADARKAEAERLKNPIESLRYQRQLLENLRLLEAIDQELSTARIELAALTNLPLGTQLTVVEPSAAADGRWLDMPVEKMETLALTRNADLRESVYNSRIAQQETRRALLKLFPGLSFNYGSKHSDDSYLINQSWTEAGAQISFNLLGLLSAPAQMKLAEAGVALADQKRLATRMAVLAQLHVARLQYANALKQLKRAEAIWKADADIASHTARREEAETVGRLDVVSNRTAAILSQLRRYQALAQAQAAANKLQATLGMEPAIKGSRDMPLAELSKAVGQSLRSWNEARLDEAGAEAAQ